MTKVTQEIDELLSTIFSQDTNIINTPLPVPLEGSSTAAQLLIPTLEDSELEIDELEFDELETVSDDELKNKKYIETYGFDDLTENDKKIFNEKHVITSPTALLHMDTYQRNKPYITQRLVRRIPYTATENALLVIYYYFNLLITFINKTFKSSINTKMNANKSKKN